MLFGTYLIWEEDSAFFSFFQLCLKTKGILTSGEESFLAFPLAISFSITHTGRFVAPRSGGPGETRIEDRQHTRFEL